jgi:hypothetical protein
MSEFRKQIEERFDLDSAEPAWLQTFELACSALDTVEQLEALVASDGLVTTGSKGQVTVHPAVQELRYQRVAAARLVNLLSIPDRPRSHHKREGRWRDAV